MYLKIMFAAIFGLISGGIFYLIMNAIAVPTSALSGMIVSSYISASIMAKMK